MVPLITFTGVGLFSLGFPMVKLSSSRLVHDCLWYFLNHASYYLEYHLFSMLPGLGHLCQILKHQYIYTCPSLRLDYFTEHWIKKLKWHSFSPLLLTNDISSVAAGRLCRNWATTINYNAYVFSGNLESNILSYTPLYFLNWSFL